MAGKKIFAAIPAVKEAMHTNRNARFLRAFDHFRGSSSTVSTVHVEIVCDMRKIRRDRRSCTKRTRSASFHARLD
jgi:hypothetical protein